MTTGKTLGGLELYPEKALLSREEALRLYTQGSAWMSREEGKRGAIFPGQLADLVVLTDDYFSIADEEIKSLESVLTILGGKPVYAAEEFKPLDPGDLPVLPDWSPVRIYPGYWKADFTANLPQEALRAASMGITPKSLQRPTRSTFRNGCSDRAACWTAAASALRSNTKRP